MIKTAMAKVLTLKAAAVLAAVSAGGVAVAASTGAIPNPLDDRPAPAHSTPAEDHSGKGSPSPNMRGLCTAFLAGAGSEHGKALESPAFKALISNAGGADKVESYCTTLLATPAGNASTDHPTGAPATRPSHAPASHESGDTGHPAGTATPSHRG
jgi:hypothetical protein